MADTASLTLRVDSTEAAQASRDLDALTNSGKTTESVVKRMSPAFSQLNATLSKVSGDTGKIAAEFSNLAATNARMSAALAGISEKMAAFATAAKSGAGAATTLTTAGQGAATALGATETAAVSAATAAKAVQASFDSLGASMGRSAGFSAKIGAEFQKINASAAAVYGTMPRINSSMAGFSTAAQASAGSATALATANKAAAASMQATAAAAATAGAAVTKGTAAAGAAQMASSLAKSKQALDQYGMSAKQTAFAMRLLPMQFTDIVTSLSSGMPVWQVAIQQGGQIRDSFGGIGNAFKAILQFIGPVRLAIGGVVGVLGGLAVAYAKGSAETDAYNKALILTGNYAGTTAGQLATMAQSIDAVVGTQAQAAEALAALAGTGQIGADNLERFATVAVQMERTVGQSVEKTAKIFADLAKDPVNASLRLNDEIRHLTLTVYEEIKALEDAGDATGAAALAMQAYADVSESRSGQILSNLGYIERAWIGIKDAIKEAGDSFLSIGRPTTSNDLLAKAQTDLADLEKQKKGWGFTFGIDAEIEKQREVVRLLQLRVTSERLQAEQDKKNLDAQQAGVQAARNNEKLLAGTLSKQQQLNKALDEYRQNNERIAAAGTVLDPKKVKAEEAAIRRRFSDAPKAFQDDAATRLVQASRERSAALQAQIDGSEKLGTAARALVQFEQQIADLKEKRTLTAEQKQILAGEERIRVQLQAEASLERQWKKVEETRKAEEDAAKAKERFLQRAQALQEQAAHNNEMRREQYGMELAGAGMGEQAMRELRGVMSLQREFAGMQARLAMNAAKEGTLGSDSYKEAAASIAASLDVALADHRDYYTRLKQLQSDWRVGASAALQNYLEEAENVAAQTAQAFSQGLHVFEDSFADAMDGNYKSFKDFADAMERDFMAIINRMVAKALTAELAKALGLDKIGGASGGGMGGFGGFMANLLGAGGGGSALGAGTAGTAAATAFVPDAAGNLIAALAKGGVVGPDGIDQKFANGGVVDRPTLFNYAGGKTGLMGEAGEEGILPLARGRNGKLGVQAQGMGGGGNTTTVHMTVVTADAESFRRSENQVLSRMQGGLGRGSRVR